MGSRPGWEQKWGMGFWAGTGVLRDAETQEMGMANVNGDWNGQWGDKEGDGRQGQRQELRTGMEDKSEEKAEDGQD